MPFQSLRANSSIFILRKGDSPVLSTGVVDTVSTPYPNYQAQRLYGQPELVVNITAQVDGQVLNFNRLPAIGEIADSGSGYVVSCGKDAMESEVDALKRVSESVIASVERHKSIVAACDEMLSTLHPEIAEKVKKEAELERQSKEIERLSRLVETLLARDEKRQLKPKGNENDRNN